MRLAAIDIGSNAVRLLIKDLEFDAVQGLREDRIAYYRVPLRLGTKVFESGRISTSKVVALEKTIKAFKLLLEVQGVEEFRACATSALRNADNRGEVIKRVSESSGIDIDCISGEEEAQLIFENFKILGGEIDGDLLCVDVGGGSTELSLLCGEQRVAWESFRIGTVRMLNNGVERSEWQRMAEFLNTHAKSRQLTVAGTGGNINRFHKLARLKKDELLTLKKLEKWVGRIENEPMQNRSKRFGLKNNRADVIVPAGKIYMEVLRAAGLNEIWVPKVGLSDGIILQLASEQGLQFKDL
ncbi:MAG: hypothetical protein O2818_02670 [Bacteroidetes bacterium]|nr:hypothetical protein [Bacteroidota bacterium]MDA1335769.1 hypothetical protein [Bacteroidota bacterium]